MPVNYAQECMEIIKPMIGDLIVGGILLVGFFTLLWGCRKVKEND